ncbi:MAG: DUF3109 family protein [Flavobacteriales bacterium]|nr:DUF3109 family protein [Flavobacteriales bacterium]
MIILEQTLISEDLIERKFCCDLNACKGACCIEGDRGAPLEQAELDIIQENLTAILPYLSPESVEMIDRAGFYELDDENDLVTNCLPDGKCVFVTVGEQGHLTCGIEQAYLDGKTPFQKPISCHLYPVRLAETETYTAVNYHEWQICKAACSKGELLGLPLYQFVKDALIRRFGVDWYNALATLAEQKFRT